LNVIVTQTLQLGNEDKLVYKIILLSQPDLITKQIFIQC